MTDTAASILTFNCYSEVSLLSYQKILANILNIILREVLREMHAQSKSEHYLPIGDE